MFTLVRCLFNKATPIVEELHFLKNSFLNNGPLQQTAIEGTSAMTASIYEYISEK